MTLTGLTFAYPFRHAAHRGAAYGTLPPSPCTAGEP